MLYLFADEPVVARTIGGRALVRLNGLVKRTNVGFGRVELAVRTPRGDVQRLHDDLNMPDHAGTSRWARSVSLLESGIHRASWSLDDAVSNEVAVRVTDTAEPLMHALTLEPIPALGLAGEPDLLVRLANLGDATLDRSVAFLHCAAIVEGARHTLPAPTWDGMPDLGPGAQTWFLLALDDFAPRLPTGDHDIVIELAGLRSEPVRVTIPTR